MLPAQGNRGSPPIQGGNDGKQQVFLDPYRIYIDYADSDLSYDEVTVDGIRRREKERRRQRAGITPLFCFRWPKTKMYYKPGLRRTTQV